MACGLTMLAFLKYTPDGQAACLFAREAGRHSLLLHLERGGRLCTDLF
jgi:hypothetical protein